MPVRCFNTEKMSVNMPDLNMVGNKEDVSQHAGFIYGGKKERTHQKCQLTNRIYKKTDVSQLAKHRKDVSQHAGFKYGEE